MPSAISTGRGGAGNFMTSHTSITSSLKTPHLTAPVFTTGRGGSGNMARASNTSARKAQDVEPVLQRESTGTVLLGRGGGGNVWRKSGDGESGRKRFFGRNSTETTRSGSTASAES